MKRGFTALALGTVLMLLAGCTAQTGSSAVGNPQRHDLASTSPAAVSAGGTWSHAFRAEGTILVAYSVTVEDDSAVDVGFVRESDLAEDKTGQTVQGWAFQRSTQSAGQQVELPTGDYALVISCRNSLFDCDLNYSLWAMY